MLVQSQQRGGGGAIMTDKKAVERAGRAWEAASASAQNHRAGVTAADSASRGEHIVIPGTPFRTMFHPTIPRMDALGATWIASLMG